MLSASYFPQNFEQNPSLQPHAPNLSNTTNQLRLMQRTYVQSNLVLRNQVRSPAVTKSMFSNARKHMTGFIRMSQDRIPLPSGLWHKFQDFGGDTTELFGVECKVQSPEYRIVVLPGNPGSSSYYTPFLKYIHDAFSGTAEVIGVSYVGFEAWSNVHGGRVFSLQDQIAHKVSVIRGLCENFEGTTIVIGHSIGAYIALHAVERLQGLMGSGFSAPLVVALFPFFAGNPLCRKQKVLRTVTKFASSLSMAAWLTSALLPPRILELIVSQFDRSLDAHALSATVGLWSHNHTRNILHLGSCEFRELGKPLEWDLLRKWARNVLLVHASKDVWFPHWQRVEIEKELEDLQMVHAKDQIHAFCVSEEMSERLAKTISKTIRVKMKTPQMRGVRQELRT